jgi:hypothetical protein
MKVDMLEVSSKIIEFFRLAYYSTHVRVCQPLFEKNFDYFDLDIKMLSNALEIAQNRGGSSRVVSLLTEDFPNESANGRRSYIHSPRDRSDYFSRSFRNLPV